MVSELETRKQADLEELLAKGWSREDLSWFTPRELPVEDFAALPTEKIVHVFDDDALTFTRKVEQLTPEQALRAAKRRRAFDEKRARGMWVIKHEAVMRRHRQEIVDLFETARVALAGRWPEQARELHELLTSVSLRYERNISKQAAQELLDRADRIVEALPQEAAEIARLAKLSYVGEPKYRQELRDACARLGDRTS